MSFKYSGHWFSIVVLFLCLKFIQLIWRLFVDFPSVITEIRFVLFSSCHSLFTQIRVRKIQYVYFFQRLRWSEKVSYWEWLVFDMSVCASDTEHSAQWHIDSVLLSSSEESVRLISQQHKLSPFCHVKSLCE